MNYRFSIVLLAAGFAQLSYAQTIVGLKTFRQIFASLSAITEVSEADPQIRSLYLQQKERLPKDGTLDEMNTPAFYSVLTVADAYCKKWLAAEEMKPQASRKVHQDIDFSKSAATLDAAQIKKLIIQYGELFWQRIPDQDEGATLQKQTQDTIAIIGSKPATIATALRPLCISSISSLAFLTN